MIVTPPSAARRSLAVYGWALVLAVLLASLLVFDNRHLLLETPLHESGDTASNSLFVREAKSGVVIHGHYSRWNFYHPGPVLFYAYALGEAVFHDWLHVVPAPYNGQVISACLAVTLFFSLALMIFAQKLGAERGGYAFFLPLALLFAVWHYGAAAYMAPAFVATWPACPPILVFLCFVVATASVASGGGLELPLVALTGGWLVHNYVAQPLFVVPMTLFAYGGLIARCRSRGDSPPAGPRGTLAAGWRAFPRAHLAAAGVLALFILPLLIDLSRGSESNFSRILAHLRQHHEPPHKLARSLCYFLTFGGYAWYNPAENFFGRYSAGGMRAFVALHWRAYLGWVTALVATPLLFAAARRISSSAVSQRRDGFLRWFGVLAIVAFILTLFWGTKQDGEMFYFNAYFNYSIYFCAALGLAAAGGVFLQAATAAPRPRWARVTASAALVCGAAVAAWSNAASFVNLGVVEPGGDALPGVTTRTAAETVRPGQVCYLDWSVFDGWTAATGVALQLDRLGYTVRVNDNWKIMFGQRRAFSPEDARSDQPVVRWEIVPLATGPARLGARAVTPLYGIEVPPLADLNPVDGKIRFSVDGNWQQYACAGWVPPGGETTWADQPCALLQFRPLPLPADDATGVDMVIDGWSLTAAKAPTAQRVEITFDGTALPTASLPLGIGDAPTRVRIAADLWRAACARGFAKVLFRFPDARSPYGLGMNNDERMLGGGFRSVGFQVAP